MRPNPSLISDYSPEVQYKFHPVFDTYLVSSLGHVYSTMGPKLINGTRRPRSPYLKIKGISDKDGYFRISMRHAGKFSRPCVHRMVLEAFIGPAPDGYECAHKNGVNNDNRLSNLRWATPSENGVDKANHGSLKGAKNGSAKLTADQVMEIRAEKFFRGYRKPLAKKYGVSEVLIKKIRSRKVWKHLP